jgi:hypothetical protein
LTVYFPNAQIFFYQVKLATVKNSGLYSGGHCRRCMTLEPVNTMSIVENGTGSI